MDYISVNNLKIPLLTVEQMRLVDKLMMKKYGIQLIQMMENAGLALAGLTANYLNDKVKGKKIAVIAGRGNNGGGGLTAARRLHNWGAEITILTPHDNFSGTAKAQMDILDKLSIEILSGDDALNNLAKENYDLIIDALIGYGLRGEPRPAAAGFIKAANKAGGPVISLDIPSGLNADNGPATAHTIKAAATLTLALPKKGLFKAGPDFVGDLYLADISVPPELYREMGITLRPLFCNDSIIKLTA